MTMIARSEYVETHLLHGHVSTALKFVLDRAYQIGMDGQVDTAPSVERPRAKFVAALNRAIAELVSTRGDL